MDPQFLAAVGAAAFLAVVAIALFIQSRGRRTTAALASEQLADMRRRWDEMAARLSAAEQGSAAAKARAEYLAPLEPRLIAEQARAKDLEVEITGWKERSEAERRNHEQRIAELTTLRGEMDKDFRNLANMALGDSRQAFLTLADEVFKRHRAEASAEVDERRKAVEELVRPIGDNLRETREKLDQIEKERADSFGAIRTQLASVGQEAARLTSALKANPGTRGRWGEESLRNALELAGLSPHCDFETQKTFATLESSVRPDCVIRLPGNRCIVVDAKAPITAYIDAVEATDDAARAAGLKRHAESLRTHMLLLARKEYAQNVATHLTARPDFVAMYVPGDNFFAAAIERNPDLFSEAIEKGVFIVTPTTLIALAKAIAIGWRQEAIAENAREVAALGRDLYFRLCVMGDHIVKLGGSLERSAKTYNAFVASLEGSVLPQGRRFKELRVTDGGRAIQPVQPVSTEVRLPAAERDLIFDAAIPVPANGHQAGEVNGNGNGHMPLPMDPEAELPRSVPPPPGN